MALFTKTLPNSLCRNVAQLSDRAVVPKVLARSINTDVGNDVLIQRQGNVGVITLNRPKVMNAITASMAECIQLALKSWRGEVSMVLLSGEGHLFSAGGDVVLGTDYLQRYKCNLHLASLFSKTVRMLNEFPGFVVSLVNGPAAGIGFSLIHSSRFNVLKKNVWLAKPESALGLCVDNGSSYALSRLPSPLGTYLALTGRSLKAADARKFGIADLVCSDVNFQRLRKDLLKLEDPTEEDIRSIIQKPGEYSPGSELEGSMADIENHFSHSSMEGIVSSLENDDSKWAKDTLKDLHKLNPVSLIVTKRILDDARSLSYSECLFRESLVGARLAENADFNKAVQAIFVHKRDIPKWSYSSLWDVPNDVIDRLLSFPSEDEQRILEILMQDDIWNEEKSALFSEFQHLDSDLQALKTNINFDINVAKQ